MTDELACIASVDEVPTDSTLLFTVTDADGELEEAFLTRLSDDTVVAFRNVCQHWTDVRLDDGDGALVRPGEVVCEKHGATFQLDSGYCDFGPCQGSMLTTVSLTVEDNAVFLDDDDYAFEHLGESGVASGQGSGSRIDFTGA